jgi:ubiquitin-protein ligase
MFNMQKKLKQEVNKTVDIRQRLLQKEFEDLKHLPCGCSVTFNNPDVLSEFLVIIRPDADSLWNGGTFEFLVQVPESYNFEVK